MPGTAVKRPPKRKLTNLQRVEIVNVLTKRKLEKYDYEFELCRRNLPYFMSNYYMTLDRNAKEGENPVKNFPNVYDERWRYILVLLNSFLDNQLLLWIKSRRMISSLLQYFPVTAA